MRWENLPDFKFLLLSSPEEPKPCRVEFKIVNRDKTSIGVSIDGGGGYGVRLGLHTEVQPGSPLSVQFHGAGRNMLASRRDGWSHKARILQLKPASRNPRLHVTVTWTNCERVSFLSMWLPSGVAND